MTISSGYKYICIAINLLPGWCLTRLNRSPARLGAVPPLPTRSQCCHPVAHPAGDHRDKGFFRSAPPLSCGSERPSSPSSLKAVLPKLPLVCWAPETRPIYCSQRGNRAADTPWQFKPDKPRLKEKKDQKRLLIPSVCLGPQPMSILCSESLKTSISTFHPPAQREVSCYFLK